MTYWNVNEIQEHSVPAELEPLVEGKRIQFSSAGFIVVNVDGVQKSVDGQFLYLEDDHLDIVEDKVHQAKAHGRITSLPIGSEKKEDPIIGGPRPGRDEVVPPVGTKGVERELDDEEELEGLPGSEAYERENPPKEEESEPSGTGILLNLNEKTEQ